jgi:light-regulated signal transduction histidine kinase (bacteriophytochrome)
MQDEAKTKDQLIAELVTMRQRVNELERINQDMDAFTYTVVHDLKRQLSLILGFSSALEEEYTSFGRELLDRLSVVIQSGHKMDSTIDELMLLVHVRDVTSLAIGSLDMGGIVAEALERLAHFIRRQQIEVIVPDHWPNAVGYEPWIEEVWFTYISETMRYDEHPLRIEIGAAEQADGNSRFWVRVDDDRLTAGQQARISRIYDRFRPGLVQRIMDKLGGQFGVIEEEGRSKGLFFTLPSGE